MVEERVFGEDNCMAEEEANKGNMVLVSPVEFSAPDGQNSGLNNDVLEERLDQRPKTKEELLAVAFNEVIPSGEPSKYWHLKPLYISAHVEGIPVSKVVVDCGATVNILSYSLMRKLDKSREDLIPSDVLIPSNSSVSFLFFYFHLKRVLKERVWKQDSIKMAKSFTGLIKFIGPLLS
ncbi:hypothetical protein CerSpe_196080 [Prunus speciosa]